MLLLTEKSGFGLPAMPPEFHDTGKPIISIARFQQWLAEKAEERGVEIITATAAQQLLYNEENTVIGVRTRDRGIDQHGQPKEEFEPGSDVFAKVTIIGEVQGVTLLDTRSAMSCWTTTRSPTKQAARKCFSYQKAVSKMARYLTAGYPLSGSLGPLNGTFGGAFIYSMFEIVCASTSCSWMPNPDQDVHYLLQKLKLHPKIREILKADEGMSH